MAKPITAVVKLQVPAGQATPAPPVGTALGPHGVNIMEFVKQFNARTQGQAGMVTPVEVTIFKDRSFTFITQTPPAPLLLKKEAGIEKGSPTSIPASFLSSTAAGGVLVMKVNDRSLKIVTSTGVTIPAWPWVRALNCLTNSMMLTPWGPSAVPTGGAGVAWPAGTWSFTTAVIGLAIRSLSMSLQLQVVELDRGRPPEQGYGDADLPLVGQHLFHRSGEVRERPLGDLHDLSHQE